MRRGSAVFVAGGVVAVLAVCGATAVWLAGGAGRTHARLADLRASTELAESAAAEAVARVRDAVDTGVPLGGPLEVASGQRTAEDWRAWLSAALATGALAAGNVDAESTRAAFACGPLAGARIAPVRVAVVAAYPAHVGADGRPVEAQAVLETGVEVRGGAVNLRSSRRMRQRWLVHAGRRLPRIEEQPLGTVFE